VAERLRERAEIEPRRLDTPHVGHFARGVPDRRAQALAAVSGIDKNASERVMRAAALGRKNYFFAGSDAGER